jgi:cytochrome b561
MSLIRKWPSRVSGSHAFAVSTPIAPSEPAVPSSYNTSRAALHWFVALLLFVTFPLGIYMRELVLTPAKLRLFSYHKWIGISILVLACARVAARWTDRLPPAPQAAPRWRQCAATVVHVTLYLLIFAIPLTGWLMSSAQGFQTVWMGLLPLPDLLPRSRGLATLFKALHQSLNLLLLGVVAVHVSAALYHLIFLRDRVFSRMLPSTRR